MPDLVVVGGGAIGLGVAWRAARAGLTVVVVDEHPGRGASWAAAGLLAPVTEVHYGEEALLELTLASARKYPEFVAELADASGIDPGYRQCGTLIVARDSDDNAELERIFSFQSELGLHPVRLNGRDCRALEPGLAPSTRGGILVEDDHQIDNRAFVSALVAACERAGVEFVRAEAAALEQEARVRLESGEQVDAATVVIAAGARTASIAGVPPEAAVVRPVKGQLLHLRCRAMAPFTAHNVRGLDVYVLSRSDGRVVVGATVEEMGYDDSVTAGATHLLLDEARRLLPDVDELQFVEAVAGLRPGTPDNAPLLGATSAPGVVLATGHYRNGILLTPITADAIVELLIEGAAPPEIAPFDPMRFGRVEAATAP
jgi:glycine oxidase